MSDDVKNVDSENTHENEIVFYYSRKDSDETAPDAQDNVTDKPSMSPKKRLIISIISIVLAVIMLVSGTGCMLIYVYMSRFNYVSIDMTGDEVSGKKVPSQNGQIDSKTYEGKLLTDNQILNILLIGADTRYNSTSGNSDTMIILSIDTKHKKIKMLSLMRDTYVAIPGDYYNDKLNATFSMEGVQLTIRAIQLNYGIQIDRYAIVDFNGFKNIIDALGGLNIELTQEEIDYINWQIWINQQDEYKELYPGDYKDAVRSRLLSEWYYSVSESEKPLNKEKLKFKDNGEDKEPTAMVRLNGRQALWHARNRGEDGVCSGDDYVRTKRQRDVISIMIQELKNSDVKTAMDVIYEIGPFITTNLKVTEIKALSENIMKYLKYDIISQSAPDSSAMYVDYYYEDIYAVGNCIIIIDWDDFRRKIADFIFNNVNSLG